MGIYHLQGRDRPPREVGPQRRDFVLHHILHQVEIDAKIFVNQAIAHARHRAPFNRRVLRAHVHRNAFRRFANDFETADERALQRFVVEKLCAREARAGGFQLRGFGQAVPQKLTRLERHPELRRGYGGRCRARFSARYAVRRYQVDSKRPAPSRAPTVPSVA